MAFQYTVLDLLTASASLCGSYGLGETLNADDAQASLFELNGLLDDFSTDRLNLYFIQYFNPSLTPTLQSYSVGPSAANFPTAFSIAQIQSAACIIPGTTARKDIALINSSQWAAIGEKGIQGVFPDKLYFDYNWPIGILNFHPIPSGTISLDIYLWYILQKFTSLTQVVQLQPGYQSALEYGLAVRMYARWGLVPDQLVVTKSVEYKNNMRALNANRLGTSLSSSVTLNMPTEGIPAPPAPGGQQQ